MTEALILADEIRGVERRMGHTRTVLAGDFNMNPFESGVISAGGFNATMTRAIADRGDRIVQGRRYPFFYNPMWGYFGDATPGPPGTYYYSTAEHDSYFWNMFDQVLIRPALLTSFKTSDLLVLDSAGDQPLLTDGGIPNREIGSDHLPLVRRLTL